MADNYPIGTVADGPNGPMVKTAQGWVPAGGGGSTTGRTLVKPKSETTRRKEGGDADKAVVDAQTGAAELPYAGPTAAANAQKAAADAAKASRENALPNLAPGQSKLDEEYSKRYAEWQLGGSQDARRNLEQLRGILSRLDNENLTGGFIGRLPEWLAPQDVTDAREQVEEVVQRNLRTILGAQFTEKEGERLIARAYNPRLDERLNKQRLSRLVDQMEAAADANDAAAAFFETNGTLQGFQGDLWRGNSFDPDREKLAPEGFRDVAPTRDAASDVAGVGPTGGVTSRGGFTQVPGLSGIGQEVANMIESGASSQQVNDFLAQRYADTRLEHGGRLNLSDEQRAFFDDAIARRRASPERPLSDFITGFDRLGGYEAPDEGWTLGGAIAESPLGAGLMSAGNAVTFGNLASLAGGDAGAVLSASRDENPMSALLGDIAGSGIAMGGLASGATRLGLSGLTRAGGIGGDMLYGGVRGASETEGGIGDKAAGGLFGLAAAGGGNLLGRGIVSGAGRATRGVSDEAVRLLNERGISMTPGQIMGQNGFFGRRLASLENAIESVPFIGGNFRDRRMQGVGEYGRAQLEENLGSIGYDALGDQFSGDMLADAQRAVGDAYSFLDGRTFQPDQQLVNELTQALNAGRTVPTQGDAFGAIMDRQIGPLFDNGGNLTGRGFQDALQTLRGARSDFAREGAMGNMAGDAISDIEAALMGAVERQAPDVVEDLARANQAYAGLVPIENASISATNAAGSANQFTPAQYGRAAVNNTRRFGGRSAAARGDIPGGDLQRAAQQVLPSDVPNSGTTDRAMAAMLLPAALGGSGLAASQFTDDPLLAAILLGMAGASSQTGQRALQRALVDRPDALRNAGEYVYQLRDLGARGGGVLGASQIPWLLANE